MSGFSLTLTGRHFHSIFFLTKVRRWPLPMIWWVSLDFLQYTLQKAPLCFAWFITTGPVGQIPSHWEIYWITCQATAGLPRSDLSSGFRGAFPVLADAASFWEGYGGGGAAFTSRFSEKWRKACDSVHSERMITGRRADGTKWDKVGLTLKKV